MCNFEGMHLKFLFPLLFLFIFTISFTTEDEQIKFKSVSHTPSLPPQRCNLGQISVSASGVSIVAVIAQSLTSLNYTFTFSFFQRLMWGLVLKSFSIVGRCYRLLTNYSLLLPGKTYAVGSIF